MVCRNVLLVVVKMWRKSVFIKDFKAFNFTFFTQIRNLFFTFGVYILIIPRGIKTFPHIFSYLLGAANLAASSLCAKPSQGHICVAYPPHTDTSHRIYAK